MVFESDREEVAAFMRRAYERGLTTSTGGNLSKRVGGIMLITSSGHDKGSVQAKDIAVVDIATGENKTPELRLSIESEMHRAVYLKRSDASAVCHSHPLTCCYFSASDERINTALIAESWYLLDEVIKIPYELMGTKELAARVGEYITRGDAFLLENHGALTVGRSVLNAFDRLECMEQAAKLTLMALEFGCKEISKGERNRIALMR